MGGKHRKVCLNFLMQMFKCKLERGGKLREELSQSLRCEIVSSEPHDAMKNAGSLGSSICSYSHKQQQHTCLVERMRECFLLLFQLWVSVCFSVLWIKQLLKEVREAASRTRTRKGMQCLAASNSVTDTSNKLK